MNTKIAFVIGGIVVGLALATLSSPTNFSGYQRNSYGMMGGRNNLVNNQGVNGNNQMFRTIDKHFIEQMIPHHEGAIAMSNLALKKAKHPEIKTLATAIIKSQSKEIQDMSGWYKDWFGYEVLKTNTGMMWGGMMSQSGMHMGGQEDMTELENASDFDKAFIEQMIPHHQLAIMMANMLQSGTNRPEMLELAKNIIESQAQEIQSMQGWYSDWYK